MIRGAIRSPTIRASVVLIAIGPLRFGRCGIQPPERIDNVLGQFGRNRRLHEAAIQDRPQEHVERHVDIQAGAKLDDGRVVTPALFRTVLDEEMAGLKEVLAGAFETGRFAEAIRIFSDMSLSADFAEFLTLPAYEVLE